MIIYNWKKPMIFIVCFVVLLLVSLGTAALAAETVEVTAEWLNVRSGPAVSYARVGQAAMGQVLPLLQKEGDWAKIKLPDGQYGWVLTDYVKITGSQSVLPKELVVTGNSVNIRSGPGTTFDKTAGVEKGTVLTVLSKDGDWYQVSLAVGSKGWIAAWLAEPVKNDSKTSSDSGSQAGYAKQETPVQSTAVTIPTGKLKGLTVTASLLNVRVGPSTGTDRVTTLSQGTRMTCLGQSGDWYQVRIADGRTGWVAGWLVSISSQAVSSWSPPAGNVPVLHQENAGEDEEDSSESTLAGKIIVIDPGHGCTKNGGVFDPGAVGADGTKESDVVMAIGEKLQELLKEAGAEAILSRDGQSDITLEGRAALANGMGADVFVSVHANSAPSNTLNGTSTYFYAPAADTAWAAKRPDRELLAKCIQEKLAESIDRTDLGVRQENFAVLRNTWMPSVLVETAFISHPEEEELLSDSKFQRKIAKGIFAGLQEYFQQLK